MDATTAALLKEISLNLKLLEFLTQSLLSKELLIVFITALLSFVSAIAVALTIESIKKSREKTKLIPGEVFKVLQGATYHYRLPLTNESGYIARHMEVDLEKVIDDDGTERIIVPTPLDWTHRHHNESLRDIFPHQTALLNICEVQQKQGEFIKIRAVPIMHLKDMVVVKKGTTKVFLKYYQENGQTGKLKLKIVWNGNESFKDEDLPKIKLY